MEPAEAEVRPLLEACTNTREWNEVCDAMKARNGGNYPSWWMPWTITPKF